MDYAGRSFLKQLRNDENWFPSSGNYRVLIHNPTLLYTFGKQPNIN